MGTPKKNYITITFDTDLPNEFKTEGSTIAALKGFYKDKNPKDCGDPFIQVYNHKAHKKEVSFKMYSDRVSNLDFQVNLLREYLDEKYPLCDMMEDAWLSVN